MSVSRPLMAMAMACAVLAGCASAPVAPPVRPLVATSKASPAPSKSATKPKVKARPSKETPRIGSVCRDGTWSKSTGRGTCSGHGGVAKKVGW